MIAGACSIGFMGGIALAMGGARLLHNDIAVFIEQNRGVILGASFMLNIVGGAVAQSGAFEVYVDDQLVFSKLQVGGLPNLQEITQTVQKALLSANK